MTKVAFLLLAMVFLSCNRLSPAGFWENFKSDFLVENFSDQGPYGGHRAMYWKADTAHMFNSRDVLYHANENGWTLADSSVYDQGVTGLWTYNDKPVFPLTSKGPSVNVPQDAHLEDFPRWFGGNLTIYKFKTGWITIAPVTGDSIEENGFVLISRDRTEMAVYHLWGE